MVRGRRRHSEIMATGNKIAGENEPAGAISSNAMSVKAVLQGARLHHIGFAVASITAVAPGFAASLGARWDEKITHDPLQQARVTFLSRDDGGPLVELVEPAGPGAPLSKFVSAGGGLHHLCYEVKSLDEEVRLARSVGSLIVRPPVPAVAFGGRRIAWLFTKQKLLVEYLEAAS